MFLWLLTFYTNLLWVFLFVAINFTIYHLKNNNNSIEARSFNSLRDQYDGDEERGFKFVKKYLTLNRSELFFTDKVICIEGDTERILMPMMMLKVDNNIRETSEHMPLLSQNISIIEVGAHSHIFIPLFKFLGIKVLIITDIDAAKKTNGRYEKEKPLNAEHTSNASIRHFFEGTDLEESENQFTELVGKEESEKIKDNIRIAYQIPEPDDEDEYQASSFEDAFISLNKNFILRNREGLYNYGALKKIKEDEIEDIYEFSLDRL
ncbi:hypothetical protein CJ206_08630 [Dolosicoccus paucivorans]|nr:hypothetical protein CJ206_08630 [Dolosicoccus paucivorans]